LRQVSPEDILRARLQHGLATITRHGIAFKGLIYSSALAVAQGWFERARCFGNWSMEISYDQRSVDPIYVTGKKLLNFEKLHLVGHCARFRCLTWGEYDGFRAKSRQEMAEPLSQKLLQAITSSSITPSSKIGDCTNPLLLPDTASHPKYLTNTHKINVIDCIVRHFLARDISLKDAYFHMLQDHYSVSGSNGKGKIVNKLKTSFPSYRQFHYFLKKRLASNR
jgi:hypothetical protein